jgi:hypothetical protein
VAVDEQDDEPQVVLIPNCATGSSKDLQRKLPGTSTVRRLARTSRLVLPSFIF